MMDIFQGFFQRLPVFLILVFGISGCGGEGDGGSDRLSGPAESSALPIRVDATPTPTPNPTATPPLAPVDDTPREITLSPTPDDREPQHTKTPGPEDSEADSHEDEQDSQPPPTPLPASTPEASSKSQETPSATPVPDVENTPTPVQTPKDSPPKQQQQTDTAQKTESSDKTARSNTFKVPKDRPIITPYGITLDKLSVCKKVSDRKPYGEADTFSFSKTKKVYTWIKVSGVTPPRIVKHIYYWEGKPVATVELELEYPSMRTWSQKSLRVMESQGKWQVLVTTENEEEVLAVKQFTVKP